MCVVRRNNVWSNAVCAPAFHTAGVVPKAQLVSVAFPRPSNEHGDAEDETRQEHDNHDDHYSEQSFREGR